MLQTTHPPYLKLLPVANFREKREQIQVKVADQVLQDHKVVKITIGGWGEKVRSAVWYDALC